MIPTILIVEDNPLNLELVRDVLTMAGMRVWRPTPRTRA
jgi:CheY-like chemotaxis protein